MTGSVGTIDFENHTINAESNGNSNGNSNGESNGHSNGSAPAENSNGSSNGHSNGESNGHSDGSVPAETSSSNGHSAAPEAGKYTKIPGPLGIESASLKGKVALVTGAGMPQSVKTRMT